MSRPKQSPRLAGLILLALLAGGCDLLDRAPMPSPPASALATIVPTPQPAATATIESELAIVARFTKSRYTLPRC